MVGFEQSGSPADLLRVVNALEGWLDWGEVELHRVFSDWIGEMDVRMRPPGAAPGRAIGTLEDASMSLVERIGEWHKPWLEQGREEGRKEGLASERALLARQASSRFGGVAGEQVVDAVAELSDPERLADVGEWIVTCATREELQRRLAGLSAS